MIDKIKEAAQHCIDYYEHDDFKNNYAHMLFEDTSAITERILNLLKSWEFKQKYGYVIYSYDLAEYLAEYVSDKAQFSNEYLRDIHAYNCPIWIISSAMFGEQSEDLNHWYEQFPECSHQTVQIAFDDAGYTIVDDTAYYNLQTGIGLDLRDFGIPFEDKQKLVGWIIENNSYVSDTDVLEIANAIL